jgi:Na+/proline symporter
MQRAVSLRLQGGLKAVVWTDTLQQIIMMGSSIIVIGLGIIAVGGLDVMWQRSLEGDRIEFFKYVMTFSGPISNYWT